MTTLANEITNFFKARNAKPGDDALLKKLLQLPEVDAVLQRDQTGHIKARQELIERRKEIPGKCNAEIARTVKQCAAAAQRKEAARIESLAARDAEYAAQAAAASADLLPTIEMLEIDKELRRTSDPNISVSIYFLGQADDMVRNSIRYSERRTISKWTGESITFIDTNLSDILRTRATLKDSIAELEEMRLQALTLNEVTMRLTGIFISLEKVLASFDLAPPKLNEANEVRWDHREAHRTAPKPGSKWVDGKLEGSGASK